MKTLDIALKDLLRASRAASFWVFAFGVPFLTAVLFYFAFGGLAGQGGFDLPKTAVAVANLDEPGVLSGGFTTGQMLVDFLSSDELAQLLYVRVVDDPASARTAVDNQEAGVAVIIPQNLTSAALGSQGSAAIELYQDPTLTLGPSIVKGIVSQLVDGFAGSKIAFRCSAAPPGRPGGHGRPGGAAEHRNAVWRVVRHPRRGFREGRQSTAGRPADRRG